VSCREALSPEEREALDAQENAIKEHEDKKSAMLQRQMKAYGTGNKKRQSIMGGASRGRGRGRGRGKRHTLAVT
jgi:hypothetical protein